MRIKPTRIYLCFYYFVWLFIVWSVSFRDPAFAQNSPALKNSSLKTGAFFNEAKKLHGEKQYEKAAELLWNHIDECQRECLLFLIKNLLPQKEDLQVLRVTQILISKNEKDFEAYTLQGNSQFATKKQALALESFKKATELNPKYQPAYEGIAKIYEERKNYYELRILYQDMIDHIGQRPSFFAKLCDINTRDGLETTAEHTCQQAIELNPQIPENHVNLGIIAKNADEKEKAKYLFKKAALKFPKSEFAQYQYALILEEQKNFVDANKFYKVCVSNNPQSESCQVGVGNTSAQMNRFNESFEAFKKACALNRKNATAIRKTVSSMKGSSEKAWLTKLENLAEQCAN